MKQIWKYQCRPNLFTRELPKGAEILSFQIQGSEPMFWALVDPEAEREERTFIFTGTGVPIPEFEGMRFIDTLQSEGYVFHLFEVENVN